MTRGPARMAAAVLALCSVVALCVAAYLYYPVMEFGPGWQKTDATVVSSSVERTHDSLGRLLFQLRAVMRFDAQGSDTIGTAISPVPTHSLSPIVGLLLRFPPGSTHSIYYRRDHPEEIRFGSEVTWLNVRKPLAAAGIAAVFGFAALLMLLIRSPRECAECGERAKSYYKFCPRCGTPITAVRQPETESAPAATPGPDAAGSVL